MSNIELFDRYLHQEMAPTECDHFKELLRKDKTLAREFRIYLSIVVGICKEEEQDNMDFAAAMKALNAEELKTVIGKKDKKQIFMVPIRNIGLWVASTAAMLLICFSITNHINSENAKNAVDNLIVAYNVIPTANRGDGSMIDISAMDEKEIQISLPTLSNQYEQTTLEDAQEKQILGINLAMAYLKIHDRKQASTLIESLIALFPDDQEFIAQCNKILKQIK
ncbi:hypothetical protein JQM84_04085 [Parabacteroides distasonis]|nr:hypothetical protein [Parabacteroides distasonis]